MDEIVTCPYDITHAVKRRRFQIHLMKCERNPQYALMLATCFFNNSHRVPRKEMEKHLEFCEDRINFDERRYVSIVSTVRNRNNPVFNIERPIHPVADVVDENDWGFEEPKDPLSPEEYRQIKQKIDQEKEEFLKGWLQDVDSGTDTVHNSQDTKLKANVTASVTSNGDVTSEFEGQNYDVRGLAEGINFANSSKDYMGKGNHAISVAAEDNLEDAVAAKHGQDYSHAKDYDAFQAIATDDVMTAVRNNKDNISAAAAYGLADDSDAASSLASHTLAGRSFNKIFKKLNIKK